MVFVWMMVLVGGVLAGLTPELEWPKFLSMYAKEYATDDEYARRFQIFSDNVDYIDGFNCQAERDNKPFCLGIDKYTDLTGDEFHQLRRYELSLAEVGTPAPKETGDRDAGKRFGCFGPGFFNPFRWL